MFRKGNFISKSVPDRGPQVGKALSFPLLVAMAPFFWDRRETLPDDFRSICLVPSTWMVEAKETQAESRPKLH